MTLMKHVVGPDGQGKDVPMSAEEEAATLAEWEAQANAPAPEPVATVEDRLAALEAKVARVEAVEAIAIADAGAVKK